MPVYQSLKSPLTFNDEETVYRKCIASIEQLVFEIAEELLIKKPFLVLDANDSDEKKNILKKEIVNILDKKAYFTNESRENLIKDIFDFMFGYGQLQEYIEDEDITDIDGTKYNEFSIKKNGKRSKIDINFFSEKTFETYSKLIAIRNGGMLNENDSHCRVADHKNKLRINVSIGPRNVSGTALCIRKHRKNSYKMEDLIKLKMLDNESAKVLLDAINSDKTMLFCGKGASGKTTLLRTLINQINEMERILVVESDAEIYPDKKYCIQQKVKRSSEKGNPITLEMLVKDGLTMSLDTYCIGEITGNEAYDFIKGACSGHRFLATIHSNNAPSCINRIVSLAMSNNINESEVTLLKLAKQGVDVVVFLKKFKVKEIINIKENGILYQND